MHYTCAAVGRHILGRNDGVPHEGFGHRHHLVRAAIRLVLERIVRVPHTYRTAHNRNYIYLHRSETPFSYNNVLMELVQAIQRRWRGSVETYIHHLPGRLRVRIARVKNNSPVAQSLYRLLRDAPGVSSVTVSLTTGSVLIHYDVSKMSATALLQRMRVRDRVTALNSAMALVPPRSKSRLGLQPAPTSLIPRVRRRIAGAVAAYLIEKAFEKAIVLLIAAIF